MNLSNMPVVTVEQIVRFRECALNVEQQRDILLEVIKEIQHSMFQASIPGNDKHREIKLSLAFCTQALSKVSEFN